MAEPTNPTDAELDAFIRFRLGMLGIDLSVLPVSDSSAPADQARALASMRTLLRQNLQVLEYPLDPQADIATYYASPQLAWTDPDPNEICRTKPPAGK